jgi:SAM-dependent methyltransferase
MRVVKHYLINDLLRKIANAFIPSFIRRWLRATQRYFRLQWRRVGTVRRTGLWRVTPISRIFGLNRGLPIDRYYIEQFLSNNSTDIRGRALEVGDDFYTRKFGGNSVTKSDVLHVADGSSAATVVADLTCADHIPSDTFDCIILTQTLQMIYDVSAALNHLYRILKPGGVLLVTSHGISKIGRREGIDHWGEYWRFTAQSSSRLFKEVFPGANISVKTYGNVLAAIAFLHGLAVEEMQKEELDYFDPDYEVLITVRAVKPFSGSII